MSEMNEKKGLPCAVVRDLMPLYVENLTEEETNDHVRQHISECSVCAQALGMQQVKFEMQQSKEKRDTKGIVFLKKLWIKRIAYILLALVMTFAAIGIFERTMFTAETVYPTDISLAGCYELSDGRIVLAIRVKDLVPAQALRTLTWNEENLPLYLNVETGRLHCSLTLNTNRFNRWFVRTDHRGDIFYFMFHPTEQTYRGIELFLGESFAFHKDRESILSQTYTIAHIRLNGLTLWEKGDAARKVTPEEEEVLLGQVGFFMEKDVSLNAQEDFLTNLMEKER